MVSKTTQENQIDDRPVCDFYAGKILFITGAAGFLGTVLLEILLRCCPDISKIYILLRSKKGVHAEERKNLIFKKDLFMKLLATNPDVVKKVTALSGDTSLEKLGLNENDFTKLTKEVSIVFHLAATISFTKPLSFTINQNVISTDNVLYLCRKLENLQILVYTSSAFSCCNQKDVMEEKINDLPFSAKEIIEFGRNNNEDELMRCFHMCNPPFPNFYTFSKCVTENLLKEKAYDLPVCIIRPSIILNCMRGPLPGYVEKGSAVVSLPVAVGRGFVRVCRIDKHKRIGLVPADVVANAHVVAAFQHASKSLSSPSVFNSVTGEERAITWKEYTDGLVIMAIKKPLPHAYLYPFFVCIKSQRMYNLMSFLLHTLPAAILDLLFWISGSNTRLLKLSKHYNKVIKEVEFFTMHDWDMHNSNFLSLSKELNAFENQLFYMDFEDFTIEKITRSIPIGCYAYRVNGKPYEEMFIQKFLRHFLTFSLLCLILGSIALILYLVLFGIKW